MQIEFSLLDEVAPPPVVEELPHAAFDSSRYARCISEASEYSAYMDNPCLKTAKALSFAIFEAVQDSLNPNERCGILINSSTGKDSTLVTAVYVENLLSRLERGLHVAPAIIAVSDTGSEFPHMAMRMVEEIEAINRFAQEQGLPLRGEITRPDPAHTLLVEILGNGLGLPQLRDGKSASGYVGGNWCMARLKGKPLGQILENARSQFDFFVQCIGVRSAESARRAKNIAEYSNELPFGLTRLGDSDGRDESRIGVTPIVHWEDREVRAWMHTERPRWDPQSGRKLRELYALGTRGDAENAGECAITITKEGAVSNVCSDLSGTRFGCWACVLSVNRSLQNCARNEPRYEWLRKFHRYLYKHHSRGDARRALRDGAGLTDQTMFPKGFTLEERIFMLAMVFRAEIQSGFTLLRPEELEAIRFYWRKHGLFTLDPEDVRKDARAWAKTGKLNLRYKKQAAQMWKTGLFLGEGIPAGAYFHLLKEGNRPLELSHLVALAGWGSPLYPTLMAYVMEDLEDPYHLLVMITDTPSSIAGKTNTGLLNGLMGAKWKLIGCRQVTDWERQLSDGRVAFYEVDQKLLVSDIEKVSATGRVHPLLQSFYENNRILRTGCVAEDPLIDAWDEQAAIQDLAGKVSFEQLREIVDLVARLTLLSEELSEKAVQDRQRIQAFMFPKMHFLTGRTEVGQSKEAKDYRKKFRHLVREDLHLEDTWPKVQRYLELARKLCRLMDRDLANPALINRIAYATRFYFIDPPETERIMDDIRIALKLNCQEEPLQLEAEAV